MVERVTTCVGGVFVLHMLISHGVREVQNIHIKAEKDYKEALKKNVKEEEEEEEGRRKWIQIQVGKKWTIKQGGKGEMEEVMGIQTHVPCELAKETRPYTCFLVPTSLLSTNSTSIK